MPNIFANDGGSFYDPEDYEIADEIDERIISFIDSCDKLNNDIIERLQLEKAPGLWGAYLRFLDK